MPAESRVDECEIQYERDLFQCRIVAISNCYSQAIKRKVACDNGPLDSPVQLLRPVMLVATRELKFQTEVGKEVSILVSLFSPVQNDGLGMPVFNPMARRSRAQDDLGINSAQALVLAIQSVGNSLYLSDYHKTGRLRWENPQDGYGFPVTNTIRDLLIGSDKANEG